MARWRFFIGEACLSTLQTYLDKLKENVIVQGPLLPEPVRIITAVPMGDAVKLIGSGVRTNKVVINGKPVERDGQTFDYKMMLTEYIRRQAAVDDLMLRVELLKKARNWMGLKD
ncbi:MAG: hypothetical protein H6631_01740 [Anaerolineaceae bacterium]|nr:hypothetical protein [Anaerolineaceae bacterium]